MPVKQKGKYIEGFSVNIESKKFFLNKTVVSPHQILLDLDPDLASSPLGTFNPLLQWRRRVPQLLLHQVLWIGQVWLSTADFSNKTSLQLIMQIARCNTGLCRTLQYIIMWGIMDPYTGILYFLCIYRKMQSGTRTVPWSVLGFSSKQLIGLCVWVCVPAVQLPPAPAFSWVSERHVSVLLGPKKHIYSRKCK